MPQPLSRFDPSADISLAHRSSSYGIRQPYFTHHQPFAVAAMEVVTEWSFIELDIVSMFAQLCGGPTQDAFKVYAKLKGDGPRAAALLALIEDKLQARERDVFHVVREWSKVCERKRNHIAHHVWGTINGRTDVVLLVDPMDLINRVGPLDLSTVKVWMLTDFQEAAQACRRLSTCYHLLSGLKQVREREEVFEMLSRMPEIEARLLHRQKRTERTLPQQAP